MTENKEWKEVKLSEITTKLGDGLHGTPKYSDNGEFYFINGNNLMNGKIVFTERTRKVTEEEFFKYKKELTTKTIMVSINGTLGNIAVYDGEKVVLGKSVCYFNIKENVDKDFIKYILQDNKFKNYIINYASGTTIKNLSLKAMRNFNFFLPPLEEQETIAAILKSLDDKIEINNKMNETLEEMAQTIFKEWFVNFNFPNEEGKPYKDNGGKMIESELGMIPEGWRVEELGNLVKTSNGYSYKGKELGKSSDAMLTIKNFDRNGGFKINGYKEINISEKVKPYHYVEVGDIVIAHTDLTQGAEIIGNPIQIQTKGGYEKVIISMDIVKVEITSKFLPQNVLYYLLKNPMFKGHALSYVNGTTVLHLNKKAIPEYKFVLTDNLEVVDKLNSILTQFIKKQNLIIRENQILIRTRNILLPKLMSGKIKVK